MSAAALDGVRVTRVSELVLEVADVARSLVFYRDMLGLPVVRRSDRRAWLLAGGTRIGLWTADLGPGIASGRGGSHVHYAFNLDDAELDAAVERIAAHGLDLEVDDSRGEGRGRAVYVGDPDGNVVELWTLDVSAETEVAP